MSLFKDGVIAACVAVMVTGAAMAQTVSEERAQAIFDALVPLNGKQDLIGAPVTLNIPDAFVFYQQRDARALTEEIMGNPPDPTTLGMIVPAGEDADWFAILSYEKTGYVTDDDAASVDYDKLMRDMQKDTRASNAYRKREGYPTVELIGWATPPSYNAETHRIYWGKDLLFSDNEGEHTLNYDMRILGRGGYLSLLFVADIDDLDAIETAAPRVLSIPDFNPGQAYTDFAAGDARAGYGIAALVAGGVGIAAARNTGLLAGLLLFLKKGWILIVMGGAAVLGFLKRLLTGGKRNE